MNKQLKIGLFGFGVVGQGLWDIIGAKRLDMEIKRICIRDRAKERSLPADFFTADREVLLNDPEIDTIVELINDTQAAFEIVSRALASGKNVVSASKKMIALHLPELIALQQQHGTSLLYEGAVCGSIPIIRNLEEYYDNELLHAISGIFNGSSNYILSKVAGEGLDYGTALKQAQDLGFAETDPVSDVGGFDSKYKLCIAAAHAYGALIHPDEVLNLGIQNLSPYELKYAREKGLKLKLVPVAKELQAGKIVLFVLPKFVGPEDFLYHINAEYNGVVVQAAFADRQFFFGKGAGGHPTGSAVLSDIAALRYGYRYEYKKAGFGYNRVELTQDIVLPVYLRYGDVSQLAAFGFEGVHESFHSGGFRYITGNVRLESLLANRSLLEQPDLFIAFLGSLGDIRPAKTRPLAELNESTTTW